MNESSSGFTLLELLIVIAIIGLLASVLIPSLLSARKQSYDSGAQACAKSLQVAQGITWVDNKSFLMVGGGPTGLNKTSDGVNHACKAPEMFVKDRSAAGTIGEDYALDVWDKRGGHVFTATPKSFTKDAPGATAFSTSGPNLP